MRRIIAIILIIILSFFGYTYIIKGENPLSAFTPSDFKVDKDNVKTEIIEQEEKFSFYSKLNIEQNMYEFYFYKLADINGLSLNTVEMKSVKNDVNKVKISAFNKDDYQNKVNGYLDSIVSQKENDINIYEEIEPKSKYNTNFKISSNNPNNNLYKHAYNLKEKSISSITNQKVYDEITNSFENHKNMYVNTVKWSEEFKISKNRLEAYVKNKNEAYSEVLNGFNYLKTNGYDREKTLAIKEKKGISYETGLFADFELYGILILNQDTKEATYTNNLYLKDNGLYYNVKSSKDSTLKYDKDVNENISLALKYGLVDPSEEKLTVTFNTNGGSLVSDQEIDYGTKVNKPNDPVMEGYKFDGWYLDENFNMKFNFSDNLYENITLYAKWVKVDDYNPNGIIINLPNRGFVDTGLRFDAVIRNETGKTIYGFKQLQLDIYVDGVKRASAYFTNVNFGRLDNNCEVRYGLIFGYETIDVRWWRENTGYISMEFIYRYDVVE